MADATTEPTAEEKSALAIVKEQFRIVFGVDFGDAATEAYDVYLDTGSLDLALIAFRASDAYKARFPAMEALRRAGRPISEAAYLDIERKRVEIARMFDLPPSFYDSPDDHKAAIAGEQSPLEFQRRLTAWQAAERESRDLTAMEEINRQLGSLGLPPASDGDFLAAFIDPQRGVSAIERRLEAARVGTESRRAGFGSLEAEEALRLADAGVTGDQARQGFGALAGAKELFQALPGEAGGESFTRQQQVDAGFGLSGVERRRLERAAKRRAGEFSGGFGVAGGRGGLTALGEG